MSKEDQIKSTVSLLETYYWKYRRIATDEDLYREYLVETNVSDVLSETKYVRYLSTHGVPVDGTVTLSPKAVRWIDFLCSSDTRSIGVKAKEAGVTMAQHNTWLKNPLFQSALQTRLEAILPDERNRVHSALAREASGGNVSAIKLYLQVTGEYSEGGGGTEKSEAAGLMQGILELLEAHIPRNVLSALANDFDYLLVHGRPPERKRVSVVPERPANVLELRVPE